MFSNLNNSCAIWIKLGEDVYWHKVSPEFDNQLGWPRQAGVIFLEFVKLHDFVWTTAKYQ